MDERTKAKADKLEDILTALCNSYGLLTRENFLAKIVSGEFEVIKLANSCYGLVRWKHDKVLEVLTCTGNYEGAEGAMLSIERYATGGGAKAIIGLARWGWKPLLERMHYQTGSRLFFFRKELKQ